MMGLESLSLPARPMTPAPAGTATASSVAAGLDRALGQATTLRFDPSCPVWFDLIVVLATASVLSFGGAGLLLADLGHYSAGLVFPLGAIGTVAATALARPRAPERARKRHKDWALAALGACAVAVVQLGWNASDIGHHVVADRDPGVVVITGKWLAEHGNLVVPASNLWSGTGISTSTSSAGVYTMHDGTLQFQFAHMMSVLLAEANNLGGDRLMFVVPAVLGALGLAAIYAVGCRLVRRPWVVLAAIRVWCCRSPSST